MTCSGNTTNQDAPNGYGTGALTGITVNVVSGASVSGTNAGIQVATNNIVNNLGTITAGQNGIFTGANSSVTSSEPSR